MIFRFIDAHRDRWPVRLLCDGRRPATDPESGRETGFHGFVLWRFEGDKIAERWATVTAPAEHSSWD